MNILRDTRIRCLDFNDIETNSGRRAIVTGTYLQVDIRQRPRIPPRFQGHAVIRLIDETRVMLEPSWSPASVRSLQERERCDGRVVDVAGVVHIEAPEPVVDIAYVVGPCISPVETVDLAQRTPFR